MKKFPKWKTAEVKLALIGSGYCCEDVITSRFVRISDVGQAIFEIVFDDAGIRDTGYVFISEKNGSFFAEF